MKQHNVFILCVKSVESLPEELKERFEMLTVFDYDFPISLKALCTIWNKEELDAEDCMNGLCSHIHSWHTHTHSLFHLSYSLSHFSHCLSVVVVVKPTIRNNQRPICSFACNDEGTLSNKRCPRHY